MKVFCDAKPSILEAVGNGSYRYRWNIQEVERPAHFENEASTTQWECDEVIVWSLLSANKITEAVINELWDCNYEQKLLNEYNAAKLGVYDEQEATRKIEAYTAFLNERKRVKEQVDRDCKELGIR